MALAVVTLETGAADRALAVLDGLAAERVARYQPYWVARARVLGALGQGAERRAALALAIDLSGMRRCCNTFWHWQRNSGWGLADLTDATRGFSMPMLL